MSKLQKDSLMITHDEEIGVVYYPAKGAVSTTTPRHAQVMEQVWQDYLEDRLSQEDRAAFEGYVERSFADKPDLPMMKYTNLLETRTLGRLEIMVANKCNLNCRYCYAHGGDYDCESQVLTPESAKKYLRALFSERYISVDVVMLFGGEPTIAPDTIRTICEFFEQYSSLGLIEKMPIFTMVTNGTLIDEELAQTIQKYNIRVTVSVDGPPEINDKLRVDKAGNGTFAKIERGIRLLQKVKNPPKALEVTYTSLHQELEYSSKDIRQYLQKYFGVNGKDVLIEECSYNGYDDSLVCKYSNNQRRDEGQCKLQSIQLRRALSRHSFCDLSCGAGNYLIVLFPNGEIYPCHHFVGCSEFLIARFDGKSFDFNNYLIARKKLAPSHKLLNSACNDCWLKAICRVCAASILLSNNSNNLGKGTCEDMRLYYKTQFLALAKEKQQSEEDIQT